VHAGDVVHDPAVAMGKNLGTGAVLFNIPAVLLPIMTERLSTTPRSPVAAMPVALPLMLTLSIEITPPLRAIPNVELLLAMLLEMVTTGVPLTAIPD